MKHMTTSRPRPRRSRSPWARVATVAIVIALGACGNDGIRHGDPGTPPSGLDWDDPNAPFFGDGTTVTPYAGSEPAVLEAQQLLPTGIELQSEVIIRSCGPIGGVCHHEKEYPDLHTPANFAATIGEPCNVQSGTPEGIFDRCERTGDRFAFNDDVEIEIGYVDYIPTPPGEEVVIGPDMPGLHLYFAEPVSMEFNAQYTQGRFIRTFVMEDGTVEDLPYFVYERIFHIFDGGRHVVADVLPYTTAAVQGLLASGIEQGDLNRNGIFGARPDINGVSSGPVALIEPGNPETSYLVARMRGYMEGEPVPGSRMPLANEPLSVPEMLALFCFIEGLDPAVPEVNLENPIDYANCSYAQDPSRLEGLAVEGTGTGWSGRIRPLIEANCSGCHDDVDPEEDLTLVGPDLYQRLLMPSAQDPMGRPLIDPGNLTNSYLWLKLIGDESIDGQRMPIDPIAGSGSLELDELEDIRVWIEAGAPEGGTTMMDGGVPMPDAGVPTDAGTAMDGGMAMDGGVPMDGGM